MVAKIFEDIVYLVKEIVVFPIIAKDISICIFTYI